MSAPETTKVLAIGDVVGKAGRRALTEHLPALLAEEKPDLVIINGENAAGGFGLTPKIADSFFDLGADVITLGNHAWDQKPLKYHVQDEPRIIRALNLSVDPPGRGVGVFEAKNGARVAVAQVLGKLYMNPQYLEPFAAMETLMDGYRLGEECDLLIVDAHAEATSEKMAFGHFCDGRASFVFGTHTHIPTADAQVLPGGTALIGDLGMCGDYNSVIGMKASSSLSRFLGKVPPERMLPANGPPTLCGAIVEAGSDGLATAVRPIRVGGRLHAT